MASHRRSGALGIAALVALTLIPLQPQLVAAADIARAKPKPAESIGTCRHRQSQFDGNACRSNVTHYPHGI